MTNKKNPSDENLWFSRRGEVNLPLGGRDRQFRFRTKQIDQLEGLRKMSVLTMIQDPDKLGVGFLRDACIVGVAHQFAGKKDEPLTEDMVNGWLDDVEEVDGITFDDLTQALIKAIVGGLPGGQRLLNSMDEAEAKAKAEAEAASADTARPSRALAPTGEGAPTESTGTSG